MKNVNQLQVSKAKPLLEDIYGDFIVDNDLNKCKDKDIIFNLLSNHAPKYLDKINTKGSYWYISDASTYYFAINKSAVEINDITANIRDFYDFLEQLVYYDNKPLFASFDDEGSLMVITAIPVDNKNIRFTIFPYNYNNNKRIEEDFIIDKYTFIKQIRDVIKRRYQILESDNNSHYHAQYAIQETEKALKFLDSYLENPENFKKTYNIPYRIRLFDIAYKKPDSDWEFTYCFKDDEKSNSDYWEDLKNQGEIIKYDFLEQNILMNKPFYHYKDDKKPIRIYYTKKEDIVFTPDMDERVEYRDWYYSKHTKKWYSGDEIIPKPPIKQMLLEDFKLNISINTDISSKWYNLETYIDKNSKWRKYIRFDLIIEKNDFKAGYKFNYNILTEKFLSKLERGRDIKLDYKKERAYLWNDNKDYFSFYYNHDDKKYFLKIKKPEFIAKFRESLKIINKEIEEYKIKRQLLLNKIKSLGFLEEEFDKEFENLIYSNNEDIFQSDDFQKKLIERIKKTRKENENKASLYEYNVMYKKQGKWLLATDFDKSKTAVNLKKKWQNKIKNNEITDFKYICLDDRPYLINIKKLEKYIPTQYLWFDKNWVLSNDGSWYPKNKVMPEPKTESAFVNSINDFSFEINYLKRIDEYRKLIDKVLKGKDFHMVINATQEPSNVFNIYNKSNGLIRIYLQKYKFEYRKNTLPKVFDITINKKVFIKEFKQMLDKLDVL